MTLNLFIRNTPKAFVLSVILLISSCNQISTSNYVVLEAPTVFTPNIPVDVDPAIQKALKEAGNLYELNEIFFSRNPAVPKLPPKNLNRPQKCLGRYLTNGTSYRKMLENIPQINRASAKKNLMLISEILHPP